MKTYYFLDLSGNILDTQTLEPDQVSQAVGELSAFCNVDADEIEVEETAASKALSALQKRFSDFVADRFNYSTRQDFPPSQAQIDRNMGR